MPITQSPSAVDLFKRLEDIGMKELAALRKEVVKPHNAKQPRVWGIKEAAAMIGRSEPWLRDVDHQCPKNEKGHRCYTLERINEIRRAHSLLWVRPKDYPPAIVAVQNFKGGVAKTTTSIHLAHKGAMSGLRVLLVDLDPQASLTYCAGNMIPDLELSWDQVINKAMLDDSSDFQYLPMETYFPNVDLVPTNLQLQDVEIALSDPSHEGPGSVATRLQRALAFVYDDYDLIILDCPPNLGYITSNAIVAANAMLIPVPPSALDRASFVLLSRSLRILFEKSNKQFDWVKILITKHGGDNLSSLQEARMRQIYENLVMESHLKLSVEIEKATTLLSSIYDQPKSLNGRQTRQRALETMDGVTDEILLEIRKSWGQFNG